MPGRARLFVKGMCVFGTRGYSTDDAYERIIMRRFLASFLCMAFLTLSIPSAPIAAAGDKELQNVKGSVSYTIGDMSRFLAPRSQVALDDNAWAVTGSNSMGAIIMPDSSRVIVGADTKVRLVSFSQTAVANAKFYILSGTVRFKVEHPQGSRANYTFQTPTAQIAVRGTQGDIVSDANGNLQINVYSLSNPSLPVQVTLGNGQVFTLAAGQSLTIGTIGGVISGTVSTVTQSTFQPFSQFGAPENAASMGISAPTVATTVTAATTAGVTATISAINAVFAVIGAIVVNTVVHTVQSATSHPPAPGPTPAPAASPTVPIVIH